MLCFIVLHRYFIYKLTVCDTQQKSISAIFPAAFAHFLSLCHSLVILTVFQTFIIIILAAVVDVKCCLPYQQTKDAVAIKSSATAVTPPPPPRMVHPEAIPDGGNKISAPDTYRKISVIPDSFISPYTEKGYIH